MKLGPVTKIDKGNTARSREFYEFSESCEVSVILLIYSQFGAIWVVDPRRINYKTYILTSFRPEVILPIPPPPQNEPLKTPPRLRLT